MSQELIILPPVKDWEAGESWQSSPVPSSKAFGIFYIHHAMFDLVLILLLTQTKENK